MSKNYNALPDDPDWCGHALVSVRTWACADCGRPTTEATRERLRTAPTRAPEGSVWVLLSGNQELAEDGVIQGTVEGLFTDRARIGRSMIHGRFADAKSIRDVMRRTHWYQGAFNAALFEGWEEDPGERGICRAYALSLKAVDAS